MKPRFQGIDLLRHEAANFARHLVGRVAMFKHMGSFGRPTPLLGAIGIATFLALVVRLLWLAPQLKPHFFDDWDSFWLTSYACATVIAGTLVWFRQGKILMVTAVIAGAAILLLPVFSGATGWGMPKLVAITALAAGLGCRGMKWIVPSASVPSLDRVLLSIVIGFGVLCLVMMAMGLLHLWNPGIVAGLFLVLGLAVCRDFIGLCREAIDGGLRPLLSRWPEVDLRLPAIALSMICICGFGCYLGSVAPNAHWDVLHYHLGIPTIYVERGGIVPLDHTFAVHCVRNAEMLYGLGLLLEGQPLPTLFNFLFGLLCTGLVVSLGTLLAGRVVGWLAGAIFFAVPLVSYVLNYGLIDVIPATFILSASYAFFQWRATGNSRWVVLFSLLAGMATGTKLNAPIFLSPLALVVLLHGLRAAPVWRETALQVIRLALPGAIVLAPWLTLTWYRTGNPVCPFLNNIFHSSEWYPKSFAETSDWPSFGVGNDWWYALRLPWDLAFSGERFGELGWFATGGIFLLGLPFGYFVVPVQQRKSILMLIAFTAFSLAVLFKLVQYARYMIPLMTFCAILAAINCTAAWNLLSRRRRFKWIPLVACVLLGLSWLFFSRAVHVSAVGNFHPGRYAWRYVLGRETIDECMRNSTLSDYEFLKFVKEQLPDKPVIFLGIGLGAATYCGDAIEYSRWHSLKGKQLVEERSPQKLLSLLKEKQVRYLAVNERCIQQNETWTDIVQNSAALNPDFQRRYCEPLFGRNGVVLYRLHFDGRDDHNWEEAPSIVNTDLKPTATGPFQGWLRTNENVKRLPPGSHPTQSDCDVLQVTYPDCIGQQCPVHENTLYTLSAEFWSAEPGQVCMLHILWADESGTQFATNEFSLQDVGSAPRRFEMSRTSVPGARFATIWVRANGGSTVFMARPRLIEHAVSSKAQEALIARRPTD
jgi:hypothetical protein